MTCRVYLSGTTGRPWLLTSPEQAGIARRTNMLESFMYIADWQKEILPQLKRFMLDSGAFTYINGLKDMSGADLDRYVDGYIECINENGIELFYEMDVDNVVGYPKVREFRKRIERGTGKRVIPVWHLERGKQDFYDMCDEYDYVAIGGIATRDGRKKLGPYLRWFVREAHRRGCMIHGLGFTDIKALPSIGFDSVDSTAWLYGNRGGFVYNFDGVCMRKVERPGSKIDSRATARHNFIEWVRYAEYLEGIGNDKE